MCNVSNFSSGPASWTSLSHVHNKLFYMRLQANYDPVTKCVWHLNVVRPVGYSFSFFFF